MTIYVKSLEYYFKGSDYKTSVEEMLKHGMKQPYINNILTLAFSAGWNLSEKQIQKPFLKQSKSHERSK
jgi:hypothetical protein